MYISMSDFSSIIAYIIGILIDKKKVLISVKCCFIKTAHMILKLENRFLLEKGDTWGEKKLVCLYLSLIKEKKIQNDT